MNYNEMLMCHFYFYHSRFENAIKSFGRHFFEGVDASQKQVTENAPVYRKNVPLEEFKTIYERYCFLNDLEIRDPVEARRLRCSPPTITNSVPRTRVRL